MGCKGKGNLYQGSLTENLLLVNLIICILALSSLPLRFYFFLLLHSITFYQLAGTEQSYPEIRQTGNLGDPFGAIANFISYLLRTLTPAKMSSAAKNDQKLGRSSPESAGLTEDETVAAVKNGTVVNASGYKDQLKRQYGLVGLAGIAVTVDNAWVALGSSISVSIGMFTSPHHLIIRSKI